MTDTLRDDFAIARACLDFIEEQLSAGQENPEKVRLTIIKVIGALMAHGRPPIKAGRGSRGLGFDFDEAQIMASLPDFGGSIEKAARDHWQSDREDMVDAKLRRLYRHKKELEEAGEEF